MRKMLPLIHEETESIISRTFCFVFKQKFQYIDNSNDSNHVSNGRNDKKFDLKNSHEDGHKIDGVDNHSNSKEFDHIMFNKSGK